MYLFKAYIAYALNQYYSLKNETTTFMLVLAPYKSRSFVFPVSDCCCDICSLWVHTCRAENVLAYDQTPRISFYILVMDPKTPSKYIPKTVVEEAIRLALCHSRC